MSIKTVALGLMLLSPNAFAGAQGFWERPLAISGSTNLTVATTARKEPTVLSTIRTAEPALTLALARDNKGFPGVNRAVSFAARMPAYALCSLANNARTP